MAWEKGAMRSLGYHSKPKDSMPNLYSRDELAAPLRQLRIVEEAVAVGDFDPDATRSGRFTKKRKLDKKDDLRFLLSKKERKLHKLWANSDTSPCKMASVAGDFKLADAVPRLTASVCKRCFKAEVQQGSTGTEALEMICATYGTSE